MKVSFTLIITIFLVIWIRPIYSQSQDDFVIQDAYQQQSGQYNQQTYSQQQQLNLQKQYFSQRRTACLILSRYYTNQFTQDINTLVKSLTPQDQQKYINKLFTTAIQKCEPVITQREVVQFFTPENQNFDPSGMFYIFQGFNFNQISIDFQKLTANQEAILKYIKQFDSEMQIKKQEKQAQKMNDERDDGVQIFFFSLKNLPNQMKYIYIILVVLISGIVLYYAFGQLNNKPQKKPNKRRKRQ